MAIMVLLIALGVFLGIDALRASYTRSERDTIVSLLTEARSRSLANIDESVWGVCISGANYVVFKGSVCDDSGPSSELTPIGASVQVVQASAVVFTAVSGTTTPADWVIKQHGRVSTTTINYEGTIIW